MNARPPEGDEPEDLDASDWLTSQFDPTGELPKQTPVPPAQPVSPPPVQPVQPPAGGQPVLPPQFPVQPGTPMQARPSQPVQPQPPAARAQPPVQPPAQPQQSPAQQPQGQQPPTQQPPAQQPPPQQPPAQGGFSWGLTPGSQEPAASAPAQPPAATPPATPPAATPPGAWFEASSPPAPAPGSPPPPQQPQFPGGQPQHPVPPHPHEPAPLDAVLEGSPGEAQPPAEPMPFETAALPDVAPDARDAPPFWEPEPTQMMDALELERDAQPEQPPRQPFGRSVFPEGTELLPEQQPAQPAFGAPPGETGAISALDALFGESQFKEYEAGIADPNQNPFARREVDEPLPGDSGGPGGRKPGPAPAVSRLQRILLIVLGSMLAVLALVGLFFLGIRLPSILGPAPAVTAPSASPSPSASAPIALGPVAPGTYHYDELLGRECLDPYQSPWQDEYTVVDCANPHPAQLVHRGEVPEDETALGVYPGEEVLQEQVLQLCKATGIYSKDASKIKDGVIAASYPTAEQWGEGSRTFFCFVTRSSGDPLTGDITLPPKEPKPTPSPTSAG